MKKVILSLAILAIATLTATAQTGEGTWLLGGSAGFATSSQSGVSGSTTTVVIAPNIGYFFADDFAAGAHVSFGSASSNNVTNTNFNIGPFVRYYFLPLGDNAKLFADGSLGFGSESVTGYPSTSSTSWQIKAGPAFFLNQHTALEAALAYGSDKPKGYNATNTFSVQVGFQIHFGGGSSKKK